MYDDKTTIDLMQKNINSLKKGSLRFWGDWFGRPMDNYHIIVYVQFVESDNTLILKFNEGESLIVLDPVNIKFNSSEFYIRSASKIRWEWFSYGQPRNIQNLYYREYVKQDRSIIVVSGKGELEYLGKKTIAAVGQHAIEVC